MSTSVVDAFCSSNPLIKAALHIACAPFILELTRLGIKMDGMIARDGHLKGASEWLLEIGADSGAEFMAQKMCRSRGRSFLWAIMPAWATRIRC